MEYKITPTNILLFDLDGTLVETNFANFLSYEKAIISVTKSNQNLIYNPDKRLNRSNLKTYITGLTEIEYQKIIQKKEKYYNDFLHKTKLNERMTQILFKYSKTNKTILVTNSRKNRAMTTLKYFGLENKFNNIFCRESNDIENKVNKFQKAILKLKVPPILVIVFEDEETEIANAKEVGIKIINPIIF